MIEEVCWVSIVLFLGREMCIRLQLRLQSRLSGGTCSSEHWLSGLACHSMPCGEKQAEREREREREREGGEGGGGGGGHGISQIQYCRVPKNGQAGISFKNKNDPRLEK